MNLLDIHQLFPSKYISVIYKIGLWWFHIFRDLVWPELGAFIQLCCWRKRILLWQGCCPGKCSAEKYFFNYWGKGWFFFTQMLNFLELIGEKNAFEASFSPLTSMPTASGWSWILTDFIALCSKRQSQTDSQLSLALLFLPAACLYPQCLQPVSFLNRETLI